MKNTGIKEYHLSIGNRILFTFTAIIFASLFLQFILKGFAKWGFTFIILSVIALIFLLISIYLLIRYYFAYIFEYKEEFSIAQSIANPLFQFRIFKSIFTSNAAAIVLVALVASAEFMAGSFLAYGALTYRYYFLRLVISGALILLFPPLIFAWAHKNRVYFKAVKLSPGIFFISWIIFVHALCITIRILRK